MSAWLRLVIVWLLALAVPVQGMAAASMLHCAGSHERMHGARAEAQHHAGDRDGHHADHAAHHAEAHAHAGHHGTDGSDKFSDLAQYSCAACGACCAAAALPVTGLVVPDSQPVAQWQTLPEPGRIGFLTSGPDRPPRSSPL